MADWRTVKRPDSDDLALEKLDEAARLYETYLAFARPEVLQHPTEVDGIEAEEPPAESRLGLVMHPTPMGIAVYRHD